MQNGFQPLKNWNFYCPSRNYSRDINLTCLSPFCVRRRRPRAKINGESFTCFFVPCSCVSLQARLLGFAHSCSRSKPGTSPVPSSSMRNRVICWASARRSASPRVLARLPCRVSRAKARDSSSRIALHSLSGTRSRPSSALRWSYHTSS